MASTPPHHDGDPDVFSTSTPRPSERSTSAINRARSILSSRPTLSPEEANDAASGIRYIRLNDFDTNAQRNFLSNKLRSAKYTPLNILPKALYEQFRRISNFYFLVIAAISFIPGVSPTSPLANVFPLFVVVGFGFARDVYEDIQRSIEDSRQNSEKRVVLQRGASPSVNAAKPLSDVPQDVSDAIRALSLDPALHRSVASQNIAVGDLVFVRKGQVFPCDLVLVQSSADGGVAYVSTANLDGESNLKRVVVATATSNISSPEALSHASARIRAQPPSTALYDFEASMTLEGEAAAPLDASNLLLRGSILRNTDYIYGVAVYTGFDTKVALNMRNPPSKMGSIERKLNWVVLAMFIILMLLVISTSIAAAIMQGRDGLGQWYMGEDSLRTGSFVFWRSLATFLILFSTFIPVSLFVTLEFIRVIQALFMAADFRMTTKGQAVVARATNLNEMLGEVEHILSDKTGTLTENVMRYIACSANGEIYNIAKKKTAMHKAIENGVEPVKQLVLAMALTHSVVPEPKSESEETDGSNGKKSKKKNRNSHKSDNSNGRSGRNAGEENVDVRHEGALPPAGSSGSAGDLPEYQGQSPDEVALVTSAREYGIALLRRTLDTLEVNRFGTAETYQVLAELEFNSDRKRMSMIMRCPDGKLRMFTKGADSIMLKLVEGSTDLDTIQSHIDEFAKEGLRTLVFTVKELSEAEFNEWFARFTDARNSLEGRDAKVADVSAEIEQNLVYVATTAVEDKLQDKVPETIKFMREAGVKLWVLTGDKRETAENIGYSANLLDRNMDVVHVKGNSSKEIEEQLSGALQRHATGGAAEGGALESRSSLASFVQKLSLREAPKVEEKEMGIIIDGASLHFAIEEHSKLFMEVSDHAKVVICCRVTPLQKALVVRLVREERQSMTLAIGDGGNDVSMIQEAHIGVGIFGKEGTQAARSADYAVGEFKHLLRLTALHGRYSGVRTAGTINLSFYKNIFFTVIQVFFQAFDFASGQTFHNQWVQSAFNVVVTSASPFLFGIFERDLDESTVVRFPSVYAANRDRKLFGLRSTFEYTVVYGLWHAVVVYFGVYLTFGYLKVDFSDGKDSGLFLSAFVASTITVLMTLYKILLHSHLLNWIVLLAAVLSVGVHFAVVPISIQMLLEYPLEGVLEMMLRSPTFYLCALAIMTAGFVLDYMVLMGRRLFKPSVVESLQLWELRHRKSGKEA